MIADVQRELQRRADPEKKAWWENYVKGAAFRGTPMAEIRRVVAAAVGDHPESSEAELKAVACELVAQPLSEDKLAGVLLLSEHLLDHLGTDDLPMLHGWLAAGHLGDRNSCDWFLVKVLGRMLAHAADPQPLADALIAWTASEELWVRRAGLVAFVNLAPRGDAALDGLTRRVLEGAARNVSDPRRFAQIRRPPPRARQHSRAGAASADVTHGTDAPSADIAPGAPQPARRKSPRAGAGHGPVVHSVIRSRRSRVPAEPRTARTRSRWCCSGGGPRASAAGLRSAPG